MNLKIGRNRISSEIELRTNYYSDMYCISRCYNCYIPRTHNHYLDAVLNKHILTVTTAIKFHIM